MSFPFIVVDQNQLQRADLISSVLDRCCRENLHVLIADGAGFEFSDVADPLLTWRKGLQHLAPYAELVVVSRKISDLWRDEISSAAVSTDIVEHGATKLFRQLLRQVAVGDESGIRAIVEGPLKKLLPVSQAVWSDNDQIKSALRRVHDSLKSSLAKETIKRLRQARDEVIVEWLCSTDGVRFVFQGIQDRCRDAERVALALTVEPSVIGGFVSGLAALGLDWLALGGFDATGPKVITNDLHDLECAILGAMSDSLATHDKRAIRICHAIKRSMDGRAKWFRRAITFGPQNA